MLGVGLLTDPLTGRTFRRADQEIGPYVTVRERHPSAKNGDPGARRAFAAETAAPLGKSQDVAGHVLTLQFSLSRQLIPSLTQNSRTFSSGVSFETKRGALKASYHCTTTASPW